MSISAVSSGGGYTPQVARTAPQPQAPAPAQAPVDADGDHDGTAAAAAGKIDIKL